MADAAGIIFLSRESKNPYDLDYHKEERDEYGEIVYQCDEADIWADNETLLPRTELGEEFLSCSACLYQYDLWEHIIEATGDASYGYRAYAALELEDFVKDCYVDMREVDAIEWRDVKAVRAERARLDAQRQYNQEQEAQRQQSK